MTAFVLSLQIPWKSNAVPYLTFSHRSIVYDILMVATIILYMVLFISSARIHRNSLGLHIITSNGFNYNKPISIQGADI